MFAPLLNDLLRNIWLHTKMLQDGQQDTAVKASVVYTSLSFYFNCCHKLQQTFNRPTV